MTLQTMTLDTIATASLSEQLAVMRSALRPIHAYLVDPAVEEIMLNPDGTVWVERAGKGVLRESLKIDRAEAERMMRYVASHFRRSISEGQPTLSCRLPLYGARVQALFPPVVAATTFALRRPASKVYSLAHYVEQGILHPAHAEFLVGAVAERLNIFIGGSTGSGKTTLANAVLQEIADERVLIIEDTEELQCPTEDKVPILVQPPVYTWRQAVMDAMRMRPDRIIIGEVRDGAAHDLLKSMNTGHPGTIATIHANDTRAMLDRFCVLCEEVVATVSREMVAETIQVCVHMKRDPRHPAGRSVTGIDHVRGYDTATRRWWLEPVLGTH